MEIHVLVKQTYDPNTLEPNPKTLEPIYERAQTKLSDFDLNALEEGIRMKENFKGRVVVISAGPDVKPLLIREALAMGADEAYVVSDKRLEHADGWVYANVLASLSRTVGNADLILCGECSVDEGGYQVGPRVAEKLGLPSVTHVIRIHAEQEGLRVERDLEEGREVLDVKLPIVLTVGLEINTPRLPSLLMIRAASKKPINSVPLESLGLDENELRPRVVCASVRALKVERKRVVISGSLDEAAEKLLSELVREGLVRI
ncbi:MAG: electron transfer flavoprotein subunit beta/FixA family protein [Aigarchaeota archaeon]|nr:electron transfer flavoprotein subunit beta/FixA family protein [Aigarchaeota archaeon]MDW8093224.1 electron transfer flavoprotein subunit beta/FixA family protein [Nitrososphaerota archaeon]